MRDFFWVDGRGGAVMPELVSHESGRGAEEEVEVAERGLFD